MPNYQAHNILKLHVTPTLNVDYFHFYSINLLKTQYFFMAAAAAPSFHSTRETTNYARLCRLLVDVGSDVLRETFEKKRPTGNLDTVLSSPSVHKVLLSLKKKVLNPQQWGKLYPPIKSSVIKEFRYHSTDGFAEEYMRSCSSSYRLGYTSSCNRHNP